MSKMDGVSPRKPADLEYKYNFGKSFAEVYNLIADVQKGTESAVKDLDTKLDPEEIFNRLTNYGKVQGIYRGENGDVYVNATYIKSGKLAAEYIDADNLKVKAANITGTLTAEQINASGLKVDAANITGTLTANQIDASALKVDAANVTGTLTIGQLPGSVAQTTDIPTKLSELANDQQFQTPSGVTTIVGGMITTDYVEALGIKVQAAKITGKLTADQIDATNLKVAAANVMGTLTIGQLPSTVAQKSNIPTALSQLANDAGYQNATGVTTIVNGVVTTDYVQALGIQVNAAKITGKLTAAQIDATNLKVDAANVTGTLTASQIDATSLKVSAANIMGTLAIGQLPTSVAETSDIPTNVSALTNDAGYQSASGVTTIIEGKITTDYVEALGIKVAAAKITGKLTAEQIDATNLKVSAANITGELVASSLKGDSLSITDSAGVTYGYMQKVANSIAFIGAANVNLIALTGWAKITAASGAEITLGKLSDGTAAVECSCLFSSPNIEEMTLRIATLESIVAVLQRFHGLA